MSKLLKILLLASTSLVLTGCLTQPSDEAEYHYSEILEKNKIFFAYKDLMELISRQKFRSKKLAEILL